MDSKILLLLNFLIKISSFHNFEFKNDSSGFFHNFKILTWSFHFSSKSLGLIWIKFSLINSSDQFLVELHMNSAIHSEINQIGFCFFSCKNSKYFLKHSIKNINYGTSLEVPQMVPWWYQSKMIIKRYKRSLTIAWAHNLTVSFDRRIYHLLLEGWI